ncbi:MAG: DUF1549 and DUF1553 domain-containing protein, partial [Planctomycetes bacterium]|nr:DUF1549 and DUF1553 domain-containing protein [Planctomycetota bacterium]
LLYKPTHGDEHGGGERFEPSGWEHRLLLRWIEAGARGAAGEPRKLIRFDVTPAEVIFDNPPQPPLSKGGSLGVPPLAKGGQGGVVRLKAVAVCSDGFREDVTRLTRFRTNDDAVAEVTPEGVVRSTGPGDTHVVAFYDNGIFAVPVLRPVSDRTGPRYPQLPAPTKIDELILAKLAKLGIVPSEPCSDEEFLRRVGLDLIGTLPTPAEIEAFVADPSTDKRARRVDELLETPAYAEWWTVLLSDLTGSNAQYLGTTDMNQPAANQWNAWIRRRVSDNVGWDKIAAGLVLAQSRRPGQPYDDYAAEQSAYLRQESPADFTALDNPLPYYWFRSNSQLPEERALSFGYIFLGVRLECAQCHKHPFDQWSKQDFEQFTRFFGRVKAGVSPEAREAQMQLKTKLGVPDKLDTAALRRQMYLRVSAEGRPIPWNEVWIEPPGEEPDMARLLGGDEFDLSEFHDPREPLMAWLLDRDNPYFARAFVNRVWAHYFGVGIVDPPDDFNRANPPSNAALLDWLSHDFVESGYDIKRLHRTITGSLAYQRSWRPDGTNQRDERNFSRALIRRLPAEVTIDAILQATAGDPPQSPLSKGGSGAFPPLTKGGLGGVAAARVEDRKIAQHPKSIQVRGIDYSLLIFGKPLRTTNCDCERRLQPTLLQTLYVRNDHEMLGWLERKDGWLAQVAREFGTPLDAEVAATSSSPLTKGGPGGGEVSAPPTAARIDELIRSAWLRTVSRPPTDAERQRAREHLAASKNVAEGLRDLLWALLNTQEFLTNH